ncbi:hypothetical protein P4H42_03680 [Paenibacillus macerans]|uniref:hypothetical protein n=1 Tax=Paenibacillus macerans TaxID=44252 RepID=UPI002DBD3227|nr:hypothetical protein [Paenibacillus macerans]MEC0328723.1 hypothetical protein [Paenibacillus macerans]
MTQYREVKRKADVGERIRIVDKKDQRYENGDEFIVKDASDAGVFVPHPRGSFGGCAGVFHSEYVVLEPVETANLPELLTQFLRENAAAVRKFLDEIEEKAPEAPQPKPLTRADIIAKAKADVAELLRIGQDIDARLPAGTPFCSTFFIAELHVNREKRVVTALVSSTGLYGDIAERDVAKATAKCAPGDVFHAEIGKAIALRKALGLTVPDEYTNAPQPDGPRVGAVVQAFARDGEPLPPLTVRRVVKQDGEVRMYRSLASIVHCEFEPEKTGDYILDDTDVDYGAAGAEVAA